MHTQWVTLRVKEMEDLTAMDLSKRNFSFSYLYPLFFVMVEEGEPLSIRT